jgi:hypothetical protein
VISSSSTLISLIPEFAVEAKRERTSLSTAINGVVSSFIPNPAAGSPSIGFSWERLSDQSASLRRSSFKSVPAGKERFSSQDDRSSLSAHPKGDSIPIICLAKFASKQLHIVFEVLSLMLSL